MLVVALGLGAGASTAQEQGIASENGHCNRGGSPAGQARERAVVPVDLPATATPLVGREAELATIAAALQRADIRLLTLTGAPGIGKTRLAVEAARSAAAAFAHGAVFVDLAQVTDPARVSWSVAQRLGIRPRAKLSAVEALIRALRERHLLLLLDNFEHVVEAAPEVAALLAAAPQLKVLVTSREPLRLMWEHQIAVPPLQVPDLRNLPDPAALSAVPAVALFIARGRAVDYAFAVTPENARAVAEICVRLDGLPLALELAAGQVKAVSPEAIRERLDHRLTLLQRAARDLPARHRTLRAAVGWSYSRLTPSQQALFRRLAVFIGDFALDAGGSRVRGLRGGCALRARRPGG
ncbi:MAG: AAA family ATPase [Armatimonadota bacterium]|nr:AAA family ATPase [Armatimonadota bacterium]MDR7449642.1 AAA family ATPase [Armatimonadota bacterium]MDR7458450.1 AAA family ATPase [Armatimonadota bacterium]MDR7478748.1 AAA family ATPase [Armatimonadota bacterium]MDR7488206.1 AAA family ATPase [Armatimonadota bacterium]